MRLNISIALNNRILNDNSRNTNNYSNRDLQNEAGSLTHFNTTIMDQNFEKEKNQLRKFKNCYIANNTYTDNTMNNVDTNNNNTNNNMDNNKVINNSNILENNNTNSSASIINGPLNNNNNGSRSSSNSNMDRMINSCMHRLSNVKSHNNNSFCSSAFSSNILNKKYMQNNHINNNNEDIKEDFKNLINIDFINDIDMDYEEKNHHNITNEILTRNSNTHLHPKQGNVKRYMSLTNCLSDGLLENRTGNCTSNATMKGRDYSMYENLSFNNIKDFGSIKNFTSIINDVEDKPNDINFNENDFSYQSSNINNNLTNVCDEVNIDDSCVVMPDGYNNYFSNNKSNLYDNNKNAFFNWAIGP